MPANILTPGTTQPWSSKLTLAAGMTAGIQEDDQALPFHANPPLGQGAPAGWVYGGNPNWPIQRIGAMRNMVPLSNNNIYTLFFWYNPNEIVASFQMNPNAAPAWDQIGGTAGGVPVPNMVSSQSVSWTLLFDRTYDMLYDDRPGLNRGVLKDVAALYNMLGAYAGGSGQPQSTPVEVLFAQTSPVDGVSGQSWGFTGFISSLSITYGIFRWDMIPSRCEIDVGMTLSYVPAQVPPNGVAANGLPNNIQGPGAPNAGGTGSNPVPNVGTPFVP